MNTRTVDISRRMWLIVSVVLICYSSTTFGSDADGGGGIKIPKAKATLPFGNSANTPGKSEPSTAQTSGQSPTSSSNTTAAAADNSAKDESESGSANAPQTVAKPQTAAESKSDSEPSSPSPSSSPPAGRKAGRNAKDESKSSGSANKPQTAAQPQPLPEEKSGSEPEVKSPSSPPAGRKAGRNAGRQKGRGIKKAKESKAGENSAASEKGDAEETRSMDGKNSDSATAKNSPSPPDSDASVKIGGKAASGRSVAKKKYRAKRPWNSEENSAGEKEMETEGTSSPQSPDTTAGQESKNTADSGDGMESRQKGYTVNKTTIIENTEYGVGNGKSKQRAPNGVDGNAKSGVGNDSSDSSSKSSSVVSQEGNGSKGDQDETKAEQKNVIIKKTKINSQSEDAKSKKSTASDTDSSSTTSSKTSKTIDRQGKQGSTDEDSERKAGEKKVIFKKTTINSQGEDAKSKKSTASETDSSSTTSSKTSKTIDSQGGQGSTDEDNEWKAGEKKVVFKKTAINSQGEDAKSKKSTASDTDSSSTTSSKKSKTIDIQGGQGSTDEDNERKAEEKKVIFKKTAIITQSKDGDSNKGAKPNQASTSDNDEVRQRVDNEDDSGETSKYRTNPTTDPSVDANNIPQSNTRTQKTRVEKQEEKRNYDSRREVGPNKLIIKKTTIITQQDKGGSMDKSKTDDTEEVRRRVDNGDYSEENSPKLYSRETKTTTVEDHSVRERKVSHHAAHAHPSDMAKEETGKQNDLHEVRRSVDEDDEENAYAHPSYMAKEETGKQKDLDEVRRRVDQGDYSEENTPDVESRKAMTDDEDTTSYYRETRWEPRTYTKKTTMSSRVSHDHSSDTSTEKRGKQNDLDEVRRRVDEEGDEENAPEHASDTPKNKSDKQKDLDEVRRRVDQGDYSEENTPDVESRKTMTDDEDTTSYYRKTRWEPRTYTRKTTMSSHVSHDHSSDTSTEKRGKEKDLDEVRRRVDEEDDEESAPEHASDTPKNKSDKQKDLDKVRRRVDQGDYSEENTPDVESRKTRTDNEDTTSYYRETRLEPRTYTKKTTTSSHVSHDHSSDTSTEKRGKQKDLDEVRRRVDQGDHSEENTPNVESRKTMTVDEDTTSYYRDTRYEPRTYTKKTTMSSHVSHDDSSNTSTEKRDKQKDLYEVRRRVDEGDYSEDATSKSTVQESEEDPRREGNMEMQDRRRLGEIRRRVDEEESEESISERRPTTTHTKRFDIEKRYRPAERDDNSGEDETTRYYRKQTKKPVRGKEGDGRLQDSPLFWSRYLLELQKRRVDNEQSSEDLVWPQLSPELWNTYQLENQKRIVDDEESSEELLPADDPRMRTEIDENGDEIRPHLPGRPRNQKTYYTDDIQQNESTEDSNEIKRNKYATDIPQKRRSDFGAETEDTSREMHPRKNSRKTTTVVNQYGEDGPRLSDRPRKRPTYMYKYEQQSEEASREVPRRYPPRASKRLVTNRETYESRQSKRTGDSDEDNSDPSSQRNSAEKPTSDYESAEANRKQIYKQTVEDREENDDGGSNSDSKPEVPDSKQKTKIKGRSTAQQNSEFTESGTDSGSTGTIRSKPGHEKGKKVVVIEETEYTESRSDSGSKGNRDDFTANRTPKKRGKMSTVTKTESSTSQSKAGGRPVTPDNSDGDSSGEKENSETKTETTKIKKSGVTRKNASDNSDGDSSGEKENSETKTETTKIKKSGVSRKNAGDDSGEGESGKKQTKSQTVTKRKSGIVRSGKTQGRQKSGGSSGKSVKTQRTVKYRGSGGTSEGRQGGMRRTTRTRTTRNRIGQRRENDGSSQWRRSKTSRTRKSGSRKSGGADYYDYYDDEGGYGYGNSKSRTSTAYDDYSDEDGTLF